MALCTTCFANGHESHKVRSLKLVLMDYAKNLLRHLPGAKECTIPCLNFNMARIQEDINNLNEKMREKMETHSSLSSKKEFLEKILNMEAALKSCAEGDFELAASVFPYLGSENSQDLALIADEHRSFSFPAAILNILEIGTTIKCSAEFNFKDFYMWVSAEKLQSALLTFYLRLTLNVRKHPNHRADWKLKLRVIMELANLNPVLSVSQNGLITFSNKEQSFGFTYIHPLQTLFDAKNGWIRNGRDLLVNIEATIVEMTP